MVSIMNFLNTFFVGSVVVSVVLVAMMVYHFRQRINSLETRVSTLLEIVNNIVTKLNVQEMDLTAGTMHMEGMEHYLRPRGGNAFEHRVEEIDELPQIEDSQQESDNDSEEEESSDDEESEDDIKEMEEGVDYKYASDNDSQEYPTGNMTTQNEKDEETLTNPESSIVIIEDDATLESDAEDLMLQQFDEDDAARKSSDSEPELQFPDATVSAESQAEQNVVPDNYQELTVAELKDLVGQFTPPVPYYYRMRKSELLDVVRANL